MISEAEPLTNDKAVIESHQLVAIALANQMITVVNAIEMFDKEITNLFNLMPDAAIYRVITRNPSMQIGKEASCKYDL